MPGPFYAQVAARAHHRCEYCKAPEWVFNLEFEVEHVLPRSAGGSTALDNLALACRSCNSQRGAATAAPDRRTRQTARLFDPRGDAWSAHFRLNLRTARIEGLTPVGRATARRLGMNRRAASTRGAAGSPSATSDRSSTVVEALEGSEAGF